MSKSVRVNTSIPTGLYSALAKIAAANDLSISKEVFRAIREHVAKHEAKEGKA